MSDSEHCPPDDPRGDHDAQPQPRPTPRPTPPPRLPRSSINPRFVEQTTDFLRYLGLPDEGGYRELLVRAHGAMRSDAERERLS